MATGEIGSATFGLVVGMGRFRKGLEDAEDEAKKSGQRTGEKFTEESTEEVKKGSGRWSNALDTLKPAMLAGGAALGAAAVMGLMNGLEQEAAGDRLAAQLGLDPDDAARAGEVAGDLYAQAYGESLGQVHDAVGAVMQGLTEDGTFYGDSGQIEDLTRKALDLAAAFDIDVTRSVQTAGIMLRSGLVDDGAEAFDLLTRGLQSVPPALREDLLDATDEYSQFFGQLGIDGGEAFALLVDASRDGMYELDKVGDALKELTIRSTDMSTASVEAYEAAGLNAEDMANKMLAGGETARGALGEIVTGLLGIEDPAEQANAAIALFGTPLEDMSTAEIPDFLQSLSTMQGGFGDAAGAADELGETLNDNMSTEIEAFKRQALQGLGDLAVRYVIPAIRRLSSFVTGTLMPGISRITDWARENQPLVIGIASAVGGVLVAAFVAWAVSAAAAAVATIAAAAPLILLGAAIGVLVALVVTHWDTITSVISTAIDTIQAVIGGVIDWVRRNWDLLLGILTGPIGLAVVAITRHWDTIRSGVTGAKDWIVGKFDEIVGFVTGLPDRIGSAASGMWDGIKDAFRSAINWIIDAWNGLEFRIPGFDPPGPGPTFGGFTLGVPNIPRLATGGTAVTAGLALVGEDGPELLRMEAGAQVVPLDDDVDLGGGITQSFTIGAVDPQTAGRISRQAMREARWGMLAVGVR